MIIARTRRLFGLAALMMLSAMILFLSAGRGHASEAAPPAAASIADIKVTFKMDTSVTRGMYMGDRWILPPTYHVQEGDKLAVEALARAVDSQGKPVDVSPTWKSGDTAIMTISPAGGQVVILTILKAGKTDLKVTAGGISRTLPVRAWYKNKAIHVEIAQPEIK